MLGNPYSSTRLELGPLTREIKNKISVAGFKNDDFFKGQKKSYPKIRFPSKIHPPEAILGRFLLNIDRQN